MNIRQNLIFFRAIYITGKFKDFLTSRKIANI